MTKLSQTVPETQSSRCIYRRPNGQRCRLSVSDTNPEPRFCARHLAAIPRPLYHSVRPAIDNQLIDIDVSKELGIAAPGVFNSPEEIYDFLCKLTFLLSANRISSRRAAVLAYLTSQAVRTGCVIHKLGGAETAEPTEMIIDVPRPKRDPADPYGNLARSTKSISEPS